MTTVAKKRVPAKTGKAKKGGAKKGKKYTGAFSDDGLGSKPYFLKPTKLKTKFKNV